MYVLTLSLGERKAFDWVGDRYPTGSDWRELLVSAWNAGNPDSELSGDELWTEPGEMTFRVPESVAWELAEAAGEAADRSFPCFSRELAEKCHNFCDSIV